MTLATPLTTADLSLLPPGTPLWLDLQWHPDFLPGPSWYEEGGMLVALASIEGKPWMRPEGGVCLWINALDPEKWAWWAVADPRPTATWPLYPT